MKRIVLYSVLVYFSMAFGCKHAEHAAEADIEEKQPQEVRQEHTGTVTMAFKEYGCDVLVKMNTKSEYDYLIPVGLDTKYKKEGLTIRFNYVLSRAPQGECKKGQTAVLSDIANLE